MPRSLKSRTITDPRTGEQIRITEPGDHITPDPRQPIYSWWPWIAARQKRCTHSHGRAATCTKCGTRFVTRL